MMVQVESGRYGRAADEPGRSERRVTRRAGKRPQPAETTRGADWRAPSWRKKVIVGFVAFHVVAIFLFAAPIESPLVQAARDLISPYMLCIGMTERWDMFAPNPMSASQFLRAIVITKSGQYKLYSFPRMEELPLAERYRKERYRKFAESVVCGECAGLWPDVARAVARREADPADPPERVILVKFESPMDPRTGAVGDDAAAKSTVLFQQVIQPEDLR